MACVFVSLCIFIISTSLVSSQLSSVNQLVRSVSSHPAIGFTVYLQHDIALVNQQTATFDTLVSNVGNGYNMNSGRFTAPVKGLYWFGFSCSGGVTGRIAVALAHNGNDVARANGATFGSNSAVIHLEVGDQVWVRHLWIGHDGPETLYGHQWSSFTGVLISQQ